MAHGISNTTEFTQDAVVREPHPEVIVDRSTMILIGTHHFFGEPISEIGERGQVDRRITQSGMLPVEDTRKPWRITVYKQVLVPELNMGQLLRLIRAEYLIDAVGLNKVQGKPFAVAEVIEEIEKLLA